MKDEAIKENSSFTRLAYLHIMYYQFKARESLFELLQQKIIPSGIQSQRFPYLSTNIWL